MAGKIEGKFHMRKVPEFEVAATCPYCGAKVHLIFEKSDACERIAYCYPDEGGCDKAFVAVVDSLIDLTGKTLKIEGQEE